MIFKVFGMTRPGIEPRSTGLLANTLPNTPISHCTEPHEFVLLTISTQQFNNSMFSQTLLYIS